MKHLNRRAATLAAFVAVLLPVCAAYVAYGQTTGPQIVIGLSDPASFSKILPLSDTVTPANYYKGRKMIVFRTEVTSATKNILFASIRVGRGSGSYFGSPTAHTFIGAGWDVSRVPSGTQATVVIIVIDSAGNQWPQARTVTFRK